MKKLVSKTRKAKKLPKALSQEQLDQLFRGINTKCVTGLRHRVIFETMAKAGLRVSELCDLMVADIDLDKGAIYIQQGKGKKDRVVPIGATLIDWLSRWQEVRPDSEYFFPTMQGNRLTPRQLNATLARLSIKTGVFIQNGKKKTPISCHKLRHTYATYLIDKGVRIHDIQALLGHANIITTQIYFHSNPAHLDKVIKALG